MLRKKSSHPTKVRFVHVQGLMFSLERENTAGVIVAAQMVFVRKARMFCLHFSEDKEGVKKFYLFVLLSECRKHAAASVFNNQQYGDIPLLRKPIAPKAHWSNSPLVRQPISPIYRSISIINSHRVVVPSGPTAHWSDGKRENALFHDPLAQQPIGPTARYSRST